MVLVVEEMRRVLCFFDWKAAWWIQQNELRVEDEELQEALRAYANRQAQILHDMGESFAHEWYPLLAAYGVDAEWPMHYLDDQMLWEGTGEEGMTEVNENEDTDGELDDLFD